MVIKNPTSITRPICGYCNGCKKPNIYYDLYVGIAMVVKNSTSITRPICRYYNCFKNQPLLRDLYAGIAMVVKKTNIYYETYMWVLQWL